MKVKGERGTYHDPQVLALGNRVNVELSIEIGHEKQGASCMWEIVRPAADMLGSRG